MTRPQQTKDPAGATPAPMTDTQRTVSAESLGIGRSMVLEKAGQGLTTVFRVAAGFIIAFLAVQVFSLEMVDWQYEDTAHELQASAELKVKATAVQVAVEQFYQVAGRLPATLDEIDCRSVAFPSCAAGQAGEWLYVVSRAEWLAVRPFIDDEGAVAFNCETTMLMHVRQDHRFMFCAQADDPALPAFDSVASR
jgi:hypothetical protein